MKEIPNDQPIDEIRELRRRISARFDHDPARLVAYYMQEQYRDRLVEPVSKSRRQTTPWGDLAPTTELEGDCELTCASRTRIANETARFPITRRVARSMPISER